METERPKRNMEKIINVEPLAGLKDGDIPEWLLIEILLRLPVKTVFRFKLVSKKWIAMISHPSFSHMYISRASSLQQPWTLLTNNMYVDGFDIPDVLDHELLENIYSQDFMIKTPIIRVLPLPRTHNPHNILYKVFCVSNGLVLYGPSTLLMSKPQDDHRFANQYSMCNPTTGEWITLPPVSRLFRVAITGFLTDVEDDVLASYKVVRLNGSRNKRGIINFEVFASEIGEWKDFNVSIHEPNIEFISNRTPVAFNGILHWMTYRNGFLALDPNNFLSRIIPFPADVSSGDGCNSISAPGLCDANQGRLRYFKVFDKYAAPPVGFSGFGIWILNDYESGVWFLQHRISSVDIMCDGIFYGQIVVPTPISFHPFDPDVVYLQYKGIIVSYNMKMRKLEAHGDPCDSSQHNRRIENWMVGWRWTLSFVVPPWPVSISSRKFNIE